MKITRNFKNYGLFKNTDEFIDIIENEKIDWDKFDFRQKNFHVHEETKTIPLIFSTEQYTAFTKENISKIHESIENSKSEYYHLFENVLTKLKEHLSKIIDEDGFIFRAMLVNLPAGKSVKPHIDMGKSFMVPRRIHMPIKTNTDCLFTVGDQTKHIKVGELWEINNNGIMHSVENNGTTDRIHLIVDWVKY
jgi:hypothetical protein